MEIVKFSAMVQERLKRITSTEIPKEACTNSEFSAKFNLEILGSVATFGDVEGMEEVPEDFEGGVRAKATATAETTSDMNEPREKVDQETVKEGQFFMSKEKAELIAKAARAAVDKAAAKASHRHAPPSQATDVSLDPSEIDTSTALPTHVSLDDVTDERHETIMPVAPTETSADAVDEMGDSKSTEFHDPQLGGIILPSDD